jgi:hypothetical protein
MYYLVIWYVIGCAVLATIDDKDERLWKWVKTCPIPYGYLLSIMLWPILAYFWLHNGVTKCHKN